MTFTKFETQHSLPDRDGQNQTPHGGEFPSDTGFSKKVVPFLNRFIKVAEQELEGGRWPNSLGNFANSQAFIRILETGDQTAQIMECIVEAGLYDTEDGGFTQNSAFNVAITVATALYGGKDNLPITDQRGRILWDKVREKRSEYAQRVRRHYRNKISQSVEDSGRDATEQKNKPDAASLVTALQRPALVHKIFSDDFPKPYVAEREERQQREWAEAERIRLVEVERKKLANEAEQQRFAAEAREARKKAKGAILKAYGARAIDIDKIGQARYLVGDVIQRRTAVAQFGLEEVRAVYDAVVQDASKLQSGLGDTDQIVIKAGVVIERTLQRALKEIKVRQVKEMKPEFVRRALETSLRHLGDPEFTKEDDIVRTTFGELIDEVL